MNARKHRKWQQAKETVRLEPKGKRLWLGAFHAASTRTPRAAGVEGEPKSSPVNVAEHGKAGDSVRASRPDRPYRKAGQGAQQ